MNKGMIMRSLLTFLILLTLFISMTGCDHGGSDDHDPTTTSDLQGAWIMTSVCDTIDSGGYYTPLYKFTASNVLLFGITHNNENCTGDGTIQPFPDKSMTYSDFGSVTTPDGTRGHSLQMIFANGKVTNGFYTINTENKLCLSYIFGMIEDSTSTAIDYENCMTKFENNTVNKSITSIIYSFQDASIPPEYHRSFTITVTNSILHIIVNSYNNILTDVTIDVPENIITDLVRYIDTYNIQVRDREQDRGCTGGTFKSLTVYSDTDILLNGMTSTKKCDGHFEGNLSGDIDSFSKKIEDIVKQVYPDFVNAIRS